MPIIRSAKKKLRQDKKRTKINSLLKKQIKETIKKYKRSPNEKLLQEVYRVLDSAKKKNIFHKNKSSRLKSQLAKLLQKKPIKKAKSKSEAKKKPSKKTKSPAKK